MEAAAQVHGDIASSNVLLTRRGARGACGRLGVGRLRAKARPLQLHAPLTCLLACWAPAAACGAGANTHPGRARAEQNQAAHTSTHPGRAGALPRTCCETRTLRSASCHTIAHRMGCVAHSRAGHALPRQQARACHAAPPTAQLGRLAGQVADFGCAHLAPIRGIKAVPHPHGALAYQPPELLEGGVGSPAADCYAFGVLLWEMLTAQARPHYPRYLALGFWRFCVAYDKTRLCLYLVTCAYTATAVR